MTVMLSDWLLQALGSDLMWTAACTSHCTGPLPSKERIELLLPYSEPGRNGDIEENKRSTSMALSIAVSVSVSIHG